MRDLDRDILAAYGRPPLVRRAYLRLRLLHGRFDGVVRSLAGSRLVVDLGCGDGLLAHWIVRANAPTSVIGVDWDASRVHRLRESADGLRIEAVHAAMEDYALPPCDGVALVDVAHYLGSAAQERVIGRAVSALRPGGVLALRVPDVEAGWRFKTSVLHERVFRTLGWTRARWGRLRPPSAWHALLRAHGMAVTLEDLPDGSPYADRLIVGRLP